MNFEQASHALCVAYMKLYRTSPYKEEDINGMIPCCKNYVEGDDKFVLFFHPVEQRPVLYAFEGVYGPYPPIRVSGPEVIPEDRANDWILTEWYIGGFARDEGLV